MNFEPILTSKLLFRGQNWNEFWKFISILSSKLLEQNYQKFIIIMDSFRLGVNEDDSFQLSAVEERSEEAKIEELINKFKATPSEVLAKNGKVAGSLSLEELKIIASHLQMSKTASKSELIKNISEKLSFQQVFMRWLKLTLQI